MHAVVTRSTIHDIEAARKLLKEQGVPRISQAPGFVAAQFVRLDESTGTAMLTFESEETAQAAAEQLKTNPPAGDAVTINSIEVGEVVERA
jgi:ABC-type transport system substrate-binding protein